MLRGKYARTEDIKRKNKEASISSYKSGVVSYWKGKNKINNPELFKNFGRKKIKRMIIKCALLECDNKVEVLPSEITGNNCCCVEHSNKLIGIMLKTRHDNGLMKNAAIKGGITKKEGYKSGRIKNWTEGKTKETDTRIADAAKKISVKQIEAMKSGKYSLKPNKKELIIDSLLKKYNKPYKFVGDAKFWIENMNPDFVNVNGRKHVIEVFGCYWHGCKECFPNKEVVDKKEEEFRKERLAEYGYESTIIWEHEFLDIKKLEEKIKSI